MEITGLIFWRIVAFKSIHKFRAPRLGRPLFIQQQPPQPLSLPQPVLMPLPQLQNRISRMMIQHILPPKKPQLLLHIKNTSIFFDAVLPLIPWYSGRRKMCGHGLGSRPPFLRSLCRILSILVDFVLLQIQGFSGILSTVQRHIKQRRRLWICPGC